MIKNSNRIEEIKPKKAEKTKKKKQSQIVLNLNDSMIIQSQENLQADCDSLRQEQTNEDLLMNKDLQREISDNPY